MHANSGYRNPSVTAMGKVDTDEVSSGYRGKQEDLQSKWH